MYKWSALRHLVLFGTMVTILLTLNAQVISQWGLTLPAQEDPKSIRNKNCTLHHYCLFPFLHHSLKAVIIQCVCVCVCVCVCERVYVHISFVLCPLPGEIEGFIPEYCWKHFRACLMALCNVLTSLDFHHIWLSCHKDLIKNTTAIKIP